MRPAEAQHTDAFSGLWHTSWIRSSSVTVNNRSQARCELTRPRKQTASLMQHQEQGGCFLNGFACTVCEPG